MICVKCSKQMRGKAYGITVRVAQPNTVRSGDLLECPSCGTQVVASMGQPWEISGPWDEYEQQAKEGMVIDAAD